MRPMMPATHARRPAARVLLFLLLAALLLLPRGAAAQAVTHNVSGRVTLQGVAPGNLAQPLTFTLVPVGPGSTLTVQATPAAADGSYTIPAVPAGLYSLLVKGVKWPQATVAVDASAGDATGANLLLLGGDVNGDNQVSLQDLGALRRAYGSTPSSPNWNPNADLNCDGQVSLQDLGILRSNYGKVGATPQSAVAPNVRVDAGGALYTDSVGNCWAEDDAAATLATGGATDTTSATISGTGDGGLYQTQREGAAFGYNLPAPNGSYTLSLLFAEIDGHTTGQRTFNVAANGQAVLTGFDIYAAAGGANTAVVRTFPVVVTNKQLSLQFTGVVGSAAVAAIALVPARPAGDVPPPGWAADVVPTDDGSEAGGAGPGSSLGVVLPSGVEENTPGPDLGAYNPVGPSVTYERLYRSSLAASGYGSPGLSPGWVDNYDLRVTPGSGSYTLHYPNGAADAWSVSGSVISPPPGAPYLASAPAPGVLTMTFKDRSVYTFTQIPAASANYLQNTYLLTGITNLVGRSVALNRDPANNYRLQSITNDAGAMLLKFNYSGANLSSVEDLASPNSGEHRQVNYTFSGGSLKTVSQVAADGGSAPDLWRYVYQATGGQYLNSVATPDPQNPGSAYTSATIAYDPTGFVLSHTDANGRLRAFGYGPTGVQLQVFNQYTDPSPVQRWTQGFGPNNVDTGFVDAAAHAASVSYANTPSPYLPSAVTNRNTQTTSVTYDPANNYGNVATVTDARGTQVTYTYSYPSASPTDFPLGQVASVQSSHVTNGTTDDVQAATTYDYYTAADTSTDGVTGVLNGLVKAVHSPQPGTLNAGQPITTTITYDSLGNPVQMTMPGPNSTIGNPGTYTTVTYNYTTGYNSSYTQTEALGEPVSVTVTGRAADGTTTTTVSYAKYDGRGNRVAATDALGNETDFAFNLADQVVGTIYPHTGDTGTGNAYTANTYQYVGGSLSSTALFDESNNKYREVDYTYGHEGEVQSVTGSTEPVAYSYDGRYRVTAQSDGNRNTTYFDFDPIGSLIAERYPKNSGGTADKTVFTYDADQNLLTRTDGRGVTATYTRNVDPQSLVTQIVYGNLPAAVQPIGPVTFSYDNYGRRRTMGDGTGSKTYAYDDLDKLTSLITNFAGGPQGQTLTYAYNPDGGRQSMGTPQNVTNPLGSFSYQYDGVGRMSQATFPWSRGAYSGAWKYAYQTNGWLKSTTGPAALGSAFPLLRTFYNYSPRGFLSSLANYGAYNDPYEQGATGNGDTLTETSLYSMSGVGAYDAAGNRLKETATIPPIQYQEYHVDPNGDPYPIGRTLERQANHSIAFGYDTTGFGHDELIDEQSVRTDNTINEFNDSYTNLFAYDAAYNPTVFRGASVSYNPDNQIGSPGFSYDGAGNLILYPTQSQPATFTFDPEDRLTGISSPAFSAAYDGDGLRAVKTATVNGSPVTTYFLYDGGTPVIEETYSGASATLTALSGWGADGLRARYYPGNPTASQGTFYAFSYDPQGSVVQKHTPADYGSQVPSPAYDTQFYESYGALRQDYGIYASPSGSAPGHRDPVGFGGQWGNYTDVETGLLCLTHRYYDPATGRFVSRDPIDYAGGENLYGYAGNNPVNETDPDGLDPQTDNGSDILPVNAGGGMRSQHPGMHRGTQQSNQARAMTRSLVSILRDAALTAITGGIGMLGKGGEIVEESIAARRAAAAEGNSARYLARLEGEAPNAHFLSRHGAGTTLEQQYVRATTGITPDGVAGPIVDSTRFLSHQSQMNAAQRALTIYRQTGNSVVNFELEGVIGEGYTARSAQYLRTSRVRAVFRNGKLYTLFPVIR